MACVVLSDNKVYKTLLNFQMLTACSRSDSHIVLVSQFSKYPLVGEKACNFVTM